MLTITDLHNEQELSSFEMNAVHGGVNTLSFAVTADVPTHVQLHDIHFVKVVDNSSPTLYIR
jgi:type VI protein secretion system component Hcp